MKKLFKVLFPAAVAAACVTAIVVQNINAQTSAQGSGGMTPRYGTVKVFGNYSGSGVSVTNLHSSATNLNVQLDVRFQSAVALQLEYDMAAASAVETIAYARSVDDGISGGPGQTFESTLSTIALSPGAGTNLYVTNILTYGCAKIQLYYITNNHASADCTNLVVKYGAQQLASPH